MLFCQKCFIISKNPFKGKIKLCSADVNMFSINNPKDMAQKLKEMTDSHRNKIELEEKPRDKQIVQSIKGLRNVY